MTSPDPDRLRYAQIAGAVARHALGWRLTADEETVAVAELTEAAAGRADLLAERAGTALGFGGDRPDAARYRQIAELCIAAGADPALIERWIQVGRDRAAAAAAIPYTGPPPGGLLLLSWSGSVAGLDERGPGPADVRRVTDGGAHLAGAAGHPAEPVLPRAGPVRGAQAQIAGVSELLAWAAASRWRRGNRKDAYLMAIMRDVVMAAPSSSVQATARPSGTCWSSGAAGGSPPVTRLQPIRAAF
jgi:hypothetical protein